MWGEREREGEVRDHARRQIWVKNERSCEGGEKVTTRGGRKTMFSTWFWTNNVGVFVVASSDGLLVYLYIMDVCDERVVSSVRRRSTVKCLWNILFSFVHFPSNSL